MSQKNERNIRPVSENQSKKVKQLYTTTVSKYDGSKLHATPFIRKHFECSTS